MIEERLAEAITSKAIVVFLVEGMRRLAETLLRIRPGLHVVTMDMDEEDGAVNYIDILDEIIPAEKYAYEVENSSVIELPVPNSFIFDTDTVCTHFNCSHQQAAEFAIRFIAVCFREEEHSDQYLAVSSIEEGDDSAIVYGEFVLETIMLEGHIEFREFH